LVFVPFDGALSPLHWLIVAVVALLVIGPEQLPAVARRLGRGFAELRRMERLLRSEVHDLVAESGATSPEPEPKPEPAPEVEAPTNNRGRRVWPPD
jgi:TatA/E family protein of Tat protein translocase